MQPGSPSSRSGAHPQQRSRRWRAACVCRRPAWRRTARPPGRHAGPPGLACGWVWAQMEAGVSELCVHVLCTRGMNTASVCRCFKVSKHILAHNTTHTHIQPVWLHNRFLKPKTFKPKPTFAWPQRALRACGSQQRLLTGCPAPSGLRPWPPGTPDPGGGRALGERGQRLWGGGCEGRDFSVVIRWWVAGR